MRWKYGAVLLVALWLASAMEHGFVTGAWAEWLNIFLTVCLWAGLPYAIWQAKCETQRDERRQMRKNQQILDEKSRRAFIREVRVSQMLMPAAIEEFEKRKSPSARGHQTDKSKNITINIA